MPKSEFNPLVSIIIPVFNGANYMKEAIDSALIQTYKNVEVIVVNDGSRDGGETDKIAKSYGNRIRYFSKENGGVASALNYGITQMRGEYFSWLSHDDKYLPEKIESQVRALSKISDKKLVAYCGTMQIDSIGNRIGSHRHEEKKEESVILKWDDALLDLINVGCYSGCALLIPTKAFLECGKFNESLRYSQDILMWIQILLHGYGILKTSEKYVCSRIHEGQLTQTGRELFHNDSEIVANILVDELVSKSTRKHNFIYSFARYNAKYNNADVVALCIKKGKEKLSIVEIEKIRLMLFYGVIRPIIRRLYYRIFRKIQTQ